MDCVVGEVDEEGFLLVGFDEFYRFFAEVVGEVFGSLDWLVFDEELMTGMRFFEWPETSVAAKEADEVIEAAFVWMEVTVFAEVPLSESGGAVFFFLEERSEGGDLEGKSEFFLGNGFGESAGEVFFVTE